MVKSFRKIGAGAHADSVTSFDFAHEPVSGRTDNDLRTVTVNFPPGVME